MATETQRIEHNLEHGIETAASFLATPVTEEHFLTPEQFDAIYAALPGADEMDIVLHAERRSERKEVPDWRSLPDGAMVAFGDMACLVLGHELLAWSAGGYRSCDLPLSPHAPRLLTPPSTVAALRAGFVPRLHPTATRA